MLLCHLGSGAEDLAVEAGPLLAFLGGLLSQPKREGHSIFLSGPFGYKEHKPS